MPLSALRRPAIDVGLLGVLLAGMVLRLWYLDSPFLDAHSWRQVTNADIARHFADGSLNILHPRVSWGGWDAEVGLEFPLLQWVVGALWRITGESAAVGRLVAVVFSLGGIACLYGLGARLLGRPAGLAAAALMAVSPSCVFFGRTLLSDTPMLTLMIAAVWAWDVYFERPGTRGALVAAAVTALAALVKLPAILVLAPIAGAGWRHHGWQVWRDRRAWIVGAAAVAAVAAWYWYADRVYLETGLTQAVFRPSGTYPPSIAPDVAFRVTSHWTTWERLRSADVWRELADRFWQLHLTAVGSAGMLVGLVTMRGRGRAVADLWALAGLALGTVALEGQYWHEFHQLPLLPPLFLYFGQAAGRFFDPGWQRHVLPMRGRAAVFTAIGLICVVQLTRASGVERRLFRPDNMQGDLQRVGAALRSATHNNTLLVTMEYDEYGANSPLLLYYSRRQGWSFDVHSMSADELAWLREHHEARYFATMDWTAFADAKPEDAARIEGRYKRVALEDVPDSVRLFDLAGPAGTPLPDPPRAPARP